MSRIDDLISKYCPSGVEYKKLVEVVDILDSQRKPVTKGDRVAGEYAYYGANGIQDYVDKYIFDGTFLLVGEDGSVINKDKSPVLNWASGKIWVNNHAHILKEKPEIANLRYLYFYLSTLDVSDLVHGTPPKLNQQNLKDISVAIPPLPVQEEIVKILDSFTMLEAELEAELEARKKQYEHYRNKLLNFADILEGGVRLMALSEIANVTIGEFVHKNNQSDDGLYPVYNGGTSNTGFYNEYNHTSNNIIISARGANAGFVNRVFVNYWAGNSCYSVDVIDRKNINWMYVYYVLKNSQQKLIGEQQTGSIPAISKKQVENFMIPLPPLEEQERIVSILDKFDALVNDISEGLPAEIDARKQQYEYYRNKLLDFQPIAE